MSRRIWTILATTALGLTTVLSAPLAGAADPVDDPFAGGREAPPPTEAAPPAEPAPQLAAGIIVKRKAGARPAAVRAVVAKTLGTTLDTGTAVAPRVRAYDSPEVLPAAAAASLAAEVAADPDVAWAEPNMIRHAADTPWPVPVNDAYWTLLHNVWHTLDGVTSVNPWPAGGYGTKAPALWPATKGAGAVVAVLDTGILPNHPDLSGQWVAGYDMISSTQVSNDGDGRDSNPADPGDWCNAAGRPSSWHGSHVAGTIAATANNGQGIVGMAPGAKIQPIRVLGTCGGTDADIAAGIRWAAGVGVQDLPANPTPAKILNLSLGGSGACSQTYRDAIAAARGAGAALFVALGNDARNASGSTPANCEGIIGVHSTSYAGDHASYSNYGAAADVSGPGGELGLEGGGILSTVDSGTTTPVGPTYKDYQGTSMATPAVAGIGALLASLGTFTPDQMETAIRTAVAPFPTSGLSWFAACTTENCGSGIIDATKIPAPSSPPSIVGSAVPGGVLTAADGQWIGPAVGHTFTWYLNGVAAGQGTSFTVPANAGGASVIVRTSVATGAFAPIGRMSAPVTVTTPPPVLQNFSLLKKPVIKGQAIVGKSLKVTTGTWRPTPKKLTYTWLRNGKAIKGATKATYQLKRADRGKKISVRLTATRAGFKRFTVTTKRVQVRG